MSYSIRKLFAVLLLLWLPIFTGSALAASVSMQMPQSGYHETTAEQPMSHEAMMNMDMGEHDMHHGEMPPPSGDHNTCGVCQLACTGYLTVPGVEMAAVQTAAQEITPYPVEFRTVTSVPLLPPPLVRA